MDVLQAIKSDLENGFSKIDLERLIGLPKNSLSGVLAGSKKLSKKSILKIRKWDESEKPNPLDIEKTVPPSKEEKKQPTKKIEPESDNEKIYRQIDEIKKEVKPSWAAKSNWDIMQGRKIDNLKKQLK